jgi:surfactin synthase thioesterase subunit
MGGLISFEVARYLQEKYSEIPVKLIIGGWPSPAMVESYVKSLKHIGDGFVLERASDARVLEVLRANGLFNDDEAGDLELSGPVMRSVRADLKILGDYRFEAKRKLRCPITVLRGNSDPLFTTEQLRGWRKLTTGRFSLASVPGGHLFIRGAGAAVMRVVANELETETFPIAVGFSADIGE